MSEMPQISQDELDRLEALHQAARPFDGPHNQGQKIEVINNGIQGPYLLGRANGTGPVKKFLDGGGQILSYSARQPETLEAMQERISKLGTLGILGPQCTHAELNEAQINFARMMKEETGLDYVLGFRSSGTRANEDGAGYANAALRGRTHTLLLEEGYHGGGFMRRFTGDKAYRSLAGKFVMPSGPMTFLHPHEEQLDRQYSEHFDAVMEAMPDSEQPYLLTEAGVQGVAGFERLDPADLREMAQAVILGDGIWHLDGVQTTLYRTSIEEGTGRLWLDGLVDEDCAPHIFTTAKGLGGGFPFAAIAIEKRLWEEIGAPDLGANYDTYGNNLRGAAAFNAIYEASTQPGYAEQAAEVGRINQDVLDGFLEQYPELVKRRTGQGMMSGLQLSGGNETVREFCRIGLEETELLVNVGGIRRDILRIGIPFDADPEMAAEFHSRIEDTFRHMTTS